MTSCERERCTETIGITDHELHRALYYYPSNKSILESHDEFMYVSNIIFIY